MHGAVAAHEAIEVNVVQRPHYNVQGMAIQGVGEGRQFPCSQVRRQEQHALAPRQSTFEVLESVINHNLANILQRVGGK